MGDLYDQWKKDFDAAFAPLGLGASTDADETSESTEDTDAPDVGFLHAEPSNDQEVAPEVAPEAATGGQGEPESSDEDLDQEMEDFDDTLGFEVEPGEFPEPFFPRPDGEKRIGLGALDQGESKPALDADHMVNVRQASLILGFTPSAMAKMRLRGTGPVYYKTGPEKNSRILYRVGDLYEYRDRNYQRIVPSGR